MSQSRYTGTRFRKGEEVNASGVLVKAKVQKLVARLYQQAGRFGLKTSRAIRRLDDGTTVYAWICKNGPVNLVRTKVIPGPIDEVLVSQYDEFIFRDGDGLYSLVESTPTEVVDIRETLNKSQVLGGARFADAIPFDGLAVSWVVRSGPLTGTLNIVSGGVLYWKGKQSTITFGVVQEIRMVYLRTELEDEREVYKARLLWSGENDIHSMEVTVYKSGRLQQSYAQQTHVLTLSNGQLVSERYPPVSGRRLPFAISHDATEIAILYLDCEFGWGDDYNTCVGIQTLQAETWSFDAATDGMTKGVDYPVFGTGDYATVNNQYSGTYNEYIPPGGGPLTLGASWSFSGTGSGTIHGIVVCERIQYTADGELHLVYVKQTNSGTSTGSAATEITDYHEKSYYDPEFGNVGCPRIEIYTGSGTVTSTWTFGYEVFFRAIKSEQSTLVFENDFSCSVTGSQSYQTAIDVRDGDCDGGYLTGTDTVDVSGPYWVWLEMVSMNAEKKCVYFNEHVGHLLHENQSGSFGLITSDPLYVVAFGRGTRDFELSMWKGSSQAAIWYGPDPLKELWRRESRGIVVDEDNVIYAGAVVENVLTRDASPGFWSPYVFFGAKSTAYASYQGDFYDDPTRIELTKHELGKVVPTVLGKNGTAAIDFTFYPVFVGSLPVEGVRYTWFEPAQYDFGAIDNLFPDNQLPADVQMVGYVWNGAE